MFNFIASALLIHLLVNVLKVPGSMAPETAAFPPGTNLPSATEVFALIGIEWRRSPLNVSFLLALLCAYLVWLLIWRTRLGYEIRAYGHSEPAARYAGISPFKITMIAMLISGGLAGLMAINAVMGEAQRLSLDSVQGAGFVGIAVALMGRSHPVGVLIAALLFGALYQGGRGARVRDLGAARDDRRHPGAGDPLHRRTGQHGARSGGAGADALRAALAPSWDARRMSELAPFWPGIAIAWTGIALGLVSPGPLQLAVIGTAMARGRRAGIAVAVGIATGTALWAAISVTGFAAVIAASDAFMRALRVAAALYLLMLAWHAVRAARTPGRIAGRPLRGRAPIALWLAGLGVQATNLKAAVYWMAIAALGLEAGAPVFAMALLVGGCAAISVTGLSAYAVAFSRPGTVRAYDRVRPWVQSALAAFFCLASAAILTART